MKIPGFGRRPSETSGPVRRIARRLAGIVGQVPATILSILAGTTRLVGLVPTAADTTRTSGRAATSALQQLPDSTLRWLAATSVGLGTGFYLAGAPRPVVVASVAPALLLGAAVVLRPTSTSPGAAAERASAT